MRKLMIALFALSLMSGGISRPVYAADCTKDTVIDKFGDWFGNLGKKEKVKQRNIAARRANRLADCAEKQAKGTKG